MADINPEPLEKEGCIAYRHGWEYASHDKKIKSSVKIISGLNEKGFLLVREPWL